MDSREQQVKKLNRQIAELQEQVRAIRNNGKLDWSLYKSKNIFMSDIQASVRRVALLICSASEYETASGEIKIEYACPPLVGDLTDDEVAICNGIITEMFPVISKYTDICLEANRKKQRK